VAVKKYLESVRPPKRGRPPRPKKDTPPKLRREGTKGKSPKEKNTNQGAYELKEENRKLKREVSALRKEVVKLKSECRTLERAFKKTIEFYGGKVENRRLEEMIDAANRGRFGK